MSCRRKLFQNRTQRRRQLAQRLEPIAVRFKLLSRWQLAAQQQPGDFFKRRVLGQVLDGVAAIRHTRAMIGRIELVTPRHRQLLTKLAKGPVSDTAWLHEGMKNVRDKGYYDLWNGRATLRALKVEMPGDYRAYVDLGRFRNALILDELQRKAEAPGELKRFVQTYGLGYFKTSQ